MALVLAFLRVWRTLGRLAPPTNASLVSPFANVPATCTTRTQELSVDKTKVLVFGASPGNTSAWTARRGAAWAAVPPAAWTCGGLLLERVAEYKYLGVVFSAVAGIGQAAFTRLRGQLFASWERLREQFGNLHDGLRFALQRAMFQQSVPSAGSYACEAWVCGACGARPSRRVSRWRSRMCSSGGACFVFDLGWLGPLFCGSWACCLLTHCGYGVRCGSGTR